MTVPWFIGSNGALHPAAVARTLAYAATSGGEGVLAPGDMKVSATPTASNKVRIAAGACAIVNRYPNVVSQSYIDRKEAFEDFTIAATGGTARTDLLVRRVEDPDYPNSQTPADPVNGPYGKYAVVPGVANTVTTAKELNLGYPAIALARIAIPANTATITNAMITDLRKIANPRQHREVVVGAPASQDLTSTTFVEWPSSHSPMIDVPEWATWAVVTVNLGGVVASEGSVTGYLRAVFAGQNGGEVGYDVDQPAGSAARYEFMTAWGGNVASVAGTRQKLMLQGRRTGAGGETGYLRTLAPTTHIKYDVQFYERPL